jgi:acetyltransferase-like isoleucine patch superfamily enzyme
VEPDALVGIGARVMLNRVVGRGAVAGCGAVVVKDVAAGAVVKGVPAR